MQRLPPVRCAFGLAIVAMHLTRHFIRRPINPLLIVVNALPWSFLVAEPLLGSLFLRFARRALAGGWFRFRFDQAMQFAVALERDPAVVEYAER